MSAREHIVEQFEMSQMAKNGVSNYRKIEFPGNVIIITETVEGRTRTTKQPKIREEVPPEPEEWIGKNGRKIVKRLEEAPIKKVKNTNRVITGIHTKVPIIYYVVMAFGLLSAIWGTFPAASYPIYYSVVIGGIGVALVAFIGVLEVVYTKGKVKISG